MGRIVPSGGSLTFALAALAASCGGSDPALAATYIRAEQKRRGFEPYQP